MLTSITSLTGNGLKDWLIQRVSAVYITAYVLFLLGYAFSHTPISYLAWQGLFEIVWMKIATILVIGAISLHSWVGIWTVITDYIQCRVLRLMTELLVLTWLLGQFIWCLMIMGGSKLWQ